MDLLFLRFVLPTVRTTWFFLFYYRNIFVPPVQTVVALRTMSLEVIKHFPQVRGSKCMETHILPSVHLYSTTLVQEYIWLSGETVLDESGAMMEMTTDNESTRRENCPNATLFTTNLTGIEREFSSHRAKNTACLHYEDQLVKVV
jgi:hypothetical protein